MEISARKQYNRRAFVAGKQSKVFTIVTSSFILGGAMVQTWKAGQDLFRIHL